MKQKEALQEKILQLTYENQQLVQVKHLNELLSNGLEALLSSADNEELFGKLFDVMLKVIDYDAIFILQQHQELPNLQLLASAPVQQLSVAIPAAAVSKLFLQDLNLFNLQQLDWWQQAMLPLSHDYQSALTFPLHTSHSAYALVLLSQRIGAFSSKNAATLRSFSTFLASTLSQLEKRRLLEERDELKAQQQRIEQSLLRQEKLAAIGQLAAGVAHELNNPLGFIYCNLNTLQHYLQQYHSFVEQSISQYPQLSSLHTALQLDYIGRESRDLIEESLGGARRARDIINNLRTFSHPDDTSLHELDFCSILNDSCRIAQTQVKHNASLRLKLPDTPAPIQGNATQLGQILLNLINNANQAVTPGKGEIMLELSAQPGYWLLTIADNGGGIPDTAVGSIFEPFFTTKPVGQGTGLGLSLSRAIAEQHGGSLVLNSTSPLGSCFELRLPIYQSL
jgi:signal transduction histidine kinase